MEHISKTLTESGVAILCKNLYHFLPRASTLASSQGTCGQQILCAVHTIPSINLHNKMVGLQTVLVVVQSYAVCGIDSMPADRSVAAIAFPIH